MVLSALEYTCVVAVSPLVGMAAHLLLFTL